MMATKPLRCYTKDFSYCKLEKAIRILVLKFITLPLKVTFKLIFSELLEINIMVAYCSVDGSIKVYIVQQLETDCMDAFLIV